jgi:hypothetical protein
MEQVSTRKPHNRDAGYICERRNRITGEWCVVYVAAEQGIDTGGVKYATVCTAHATVISATNLPNARIDMVTPEEWCEDCRDAVPAAMGEGE